MPVWVTHNVGGNWLGGGTAVPNCSPAQQNAIVNAFNGFISHPGLNCVAANLRTRLQEAFTTIEIDCQPGGCRGNSGEQLGNRITVCDFTPNQVGPIVLHELIHRLGGSELDCVAIENIVFFGNGALDPAAEWDNLMGNGDFNGNYAIRCGAFVTWDSTTGRIWGGQTTSTTPCLNGGAIWVHDYGPRPWYR